MKGATGRLEPETSKIQGSQEDEVVKSFHITKDVVDFFPAGLSGC